MSQLDPRPVVHTYPVRVDDTFGRPCRSGREHNHYRCVERYLLELQLSAGGTGSKVVERDTTWHQRTL